MLQRQLIPVSVKICFMTHVSEWERRQDADAFVLNFCSLSARFCTFKLHQHTSCFAFAFFDCILLRGKSLWYGFDYNLLSTHSAIHDSVASCWAASIHPKHSCCWLAVCLFAVHVCVWSNAFISLQTVRRWVTVVWRTNQDVPLGFENSPEMEICDNVRDITLPSAERPCNVEMRHHHQRAFSAIFAKVYAHTVFSRFIHPKTKT